MNRHRDPSSRAERERAFVGFGPGVRAVLALPCLVLALLATMALGSWLERPRIVGGAATKAALADPSEIADVATSTGARRVAATRSAPPTAASADDEASALDRLAALFTDGDDPALAAFPIVGPVELTRSFGDARGGGRRHQGVDIMAGKLLPVVAVADGVVGWVRENGRGGTIVTVRHADGWESRYMHLNDDRPGSDDGRGFGVAPGIVGGATVHAGDVLGWVGDSGNAENTAPHLHFELHRPDGIPVDPWPALDAALAKRPSAIHVAAAS